MSRVQRDEIPGALDGERVDRVVALLAGVSRAEAAAAVAEGRVHLDDRPVTAGKERVRAGQVLGLDGVAPSPPVRPAPDPELEVPLCHVDADVIVVDKPEGVVVHPGAGTPDGTLVNGLLAVFPELADVGDPSRPGIVHRLDKGTSGLLVVARSALAYQALTEQLAERRVEREYLAVVQGVPAAASGLIDAPIGRSPRDPLRMAVVADGRPARTHYEVLEAFTDPAACALVACRLETGRTHQIRVHLAVIGHPVLGDTVYGPSVPPAQLAVPRTLLHAHRLAFDHPRTGVRLSFTSPLPEDVVAVLARLH